MELHNTHVGFFLGCILSLSLMVLKYSIVRACVSTLFLINCSLAFHHMDKSHFIYSFIGWRTFDCFHFLDIIEQCYWKYLQASRKAFLFLYFFFCYFRIYSLYRGDSLWQFPLGLYCTLVRLSPPSLPLDHLPSPLKAIARHFIVLSCIWSPLTVFPHLHLLRSPPQIHVEI
jgi:hypothetical protein